MSDSLSIEWFGEVSYAEALSLQRQAVSDRLAGTTPDRLFLVEHPPVITLGRSTDRANLRTDEADLRARGVELFEVGRGGDVTYHAPGQLVGYPILDLDAQGRRDVHGHLRRIEAGLIDAIEELGVPAKRMPGWTGVFVDRARSALPTGRERKIASIGVGIRRWVTFHGFALNVTIDLEGFESIVPCGLPDVVMTSIAEELAREEGGARLERAWYPALDKRVREAVSESMRRHLGTATA